mmetsp:Transcript_95723/g.166262  ORF Transcript_95723/g.166262 Transcript_95723/m.166262 type:complete len:438 (+) Transcript_95723:71-1384(+)
MQHRHEHEPLLNKTSTGLKHAGPAGDVTINGASIALVCTAVGAGIVTVPKAFNASGWGAGIVVFAVIALLNMLSLNCLFRCSQLEYGSSSYQSLVQRHLPYCLSLSVEISLAALLLGAIGTTLLLALHVLHSVELTIGFASVGQNQLAVPLFLITLLFCMPRNFTDLAWVNLVNLICTVGVVLLICWQCAQMIHAKSSEWLPHVQPHGPIRSSSSYEVVPFTSLEGILAAIPMGLYMFFCQIQAPQLFSELRHGLEQSAHLISFYAVASCFVIYSMIGVLGYAAFGAATQDDILHQLVLNSPGRSFLYIAQSLFSMVLLLSTPLMLTPLRTMLASKLDGTVVADTKTFGMRLTMTAVILALALLIALSVPCVDFIMSILGSTCVIFLSSTVPGILTIQCLYGWKNQVAGWTLLCAGVCCTPLTIRAVMLQHFHHLLV